MADISRLSRLVAGIQRQVDLQSNALVVGSLKVGSTSPVELTKTILTNLIALQDGSDFSDGTNAHTHDGRYFTESELQSITDSSSGADQIGATAVRTQTTVQSVLEQLDSDLSTAESTLSGHLDGGANKHDADEIDYERIDGSKKDIQATSDEVEAALTDLDDNKISKTGSIAFTGDQSMGSNKITNLANGTVSSDAVNLSQLQAAQAGIIAKPAVKVATTAVLASGTYSVGGGTNGRDAFTSYDTTASIDGVSLSLGDRVLVKDQADAKQNFIYVVTVAGVTGELERAEESDGSPAAEVQGGNTVFVDQGTANGNTIFIIDGTGERTVNTDNIDLLIYSRVENIVDGAGLTRSGTTLSVNVDDSTIEISGDNLQVKDLGISTGKIAADAVTGAKIRLSNDEFLRGRNNADSADINILKINTSDQIEFASNPIISSYSAPTADAELAPKKYVDDQLALQDDASEITYTPGDLTDWNGSADPGNVDGGLDQLADRVKTLETSTAEVETLSEIYTAGETLTAGLRGVRLGVTDLDTPETAGRVYLADPTELSLVKTGGNKDPFHVIGLFVATGEIAGADVTIIKKGKLTATSHGLAVGEPCWLSSSGAITSTAPSTSGEASVKVGIPRDANTIEVDVQIMGVN